MNRVEANTEPKPDQTDDFSVTETKSEYIKLLTVICYKYP